MRRPVLLAVAALLASCNMIYTEKPVFGAADKGTPELREGVWLVDEPDCSVDTATPASSWPECADWVLIEDGRMKFPGEKGLTGDGADEMPFLITGGEPRVWQMIFRNPAKKLELTFYAGFEALETGADGKVIRYRSWPSLCGPPPAAGPDGGGSLVTREPFPGLTMEKDGSCRPRDADALRAAVAASRAFPKEQDLGRWIRGAYP